MKHNSTKNPEIDDPGLSDRELNDFFLQFSVMLSSGIPILKCLEALSSEAHQKLGFVAERVAQSIINGHSLSGSLRQFPHSFDVVVVALVAVGEKTGKLDLILRELAKRLDNRCRYRQRITQALTYPAVVVVVSLGLIMFLSQYMLPVLLDFIGGLNVETPWPTQVLMLLVRAKWLFAILLGAVVAVLADLAWGLREETSAFRNWVLYQSPILGELNRLRIILDFCKDLALMLDAGCLLTHALDALSPACPDLEVSQTLLRIKRDLQNGESLETSLERYEVIPYVVSGSLVTGMEFGRREALLRTAANLIEYDLDSKIDRMITLIEPLTMAILGLVVGGILLASLLPIYSVISSGL